MATLETLPELDSYQRAAVAHGEGRRSCAPGPDRERRASSSSALLD